MLLQIPAEVLKIPYVELKNPTELSEGGFGLVYIAVHNKFGKIAYKELKVTAMKTNLV